MEFLDVSIIHHVGMVLTLIWTLSWIGCGHLIVYVLSLIYLYMVHEKYITRLRRRLQFEERKHSSQRRLLSDTETVRWLNHAIEKIWPICMEQIASQQFLLPIVPWFLEKYKPWTAKKAVMQQLYLGRNPPVFTEIRVLRQSGEDDHLVLQLGMNFLSADDMSAVLAVKLRKRLGFGMWAKMHITGMHIEGRLLVGVRFLRKWPFLGRLRMCFIEPPYFQMTVKPIFNHGLDVTELPGIAGWLDKLLALAFEETLVEPNMLVVNVEKFVSSPAEDWFTMDEKSATALAKVELLEAADMKPSDLNGLADPYVKIRLGSHRFQTKIQRKTLSPKWFEDFFIPITSWESDNILVLEVRDKDHIFDDTLGDCAVDIGSLRGGQRHDMWLPLKNVKMGRLHLAVTVLQGGGSAAAVADKGRECGNDVVSEEDKQRKVSGVAAAASRNSASAPDGTTRTGDTFEPVDVEGQETTGIWVHHPGSDVPQRWEPRKRRSRHPDTDLLGEHVDLVDGRSSVASGSQRSDGSYEETPKESKVQRPGSIHRGMKKIGSLFHRSPRGENPKSPLSTPRVNIEAASRDAAEGISEGCNGISQVAASPGKLRIVPSRKNSQKTKQEGAPMEAEVSSSGSSTGGDSSLPPAENTAVVGGIRADPTSPSPRTPDEAVVVPDSPAATPRMPRSSDADAHAANSMAGKEGSIELTDHSRAAGKADGAAPKHSCEASPKAGGRPISL